MDNNTSTKPNKLIDVVTNGVRYRVTHLPAIKPNDYDIWVVRIDETPEIGHTTTFLSERDAWVYACGFAAGETV